MLPVTSAWAPVPFQESKSGAPPGGVAATPEASTMRNRPQLLRSLEITLTRAPALVPPAKGGMAIGIGAVRARFTSMTALVGAFAAGAAAGGALCAKAGAASAV